MGELVEKKMGKKYWSEETRHDEGKAKK